MKKRLSAFISVAMALVLLFSASAFAPEKAAAAVGGWHLVDSEYYPNPLDITILGGANSVPGGLWDTYSAEGQEGNMTLSLSRKDSNGKGIAHVTHQVVWDTPPAYLAPNQKVGFNAEMEVISQSSNWGSMVWMAATFDSAGMTPSGATSSVIRFQSDQGEDLIRDKKVYLESSKVIPEGRAGDKKSIYVRLGTSYGYIYTYEWKEAVAPAPPATATDKPAVVTAPSGNAAESFASGSRIMWQPASGLGYRLFRSTSQGSLGVSVTDFYITSASYADVNVKPNTTYYYTVKPVLAEANPLQGIEEKLGSAIATFTVTTGSDIYKQGSYKHFIMLKMGSPYMSVDGVNQEIDPGRGTQPLLLTGRTLVPIRAVVESMGGTVAWEGGTQKITLKARGNTVEMWMGKTDLKINGAAKSMDVAPLSQNDRTFVPLRFAAENLKCKVDWINSTSEAIIVYEE